MEPITRHRFIPGRYRDHWGRPICEECGSIERATVHRPALPERSQEERDEEARRLGEEA